jgi:hypothetical protein
MDPFLKAVIDSAAKDFHGQASVRGKNAQRRREVSLEELIGSHFTTFSHINHPCKETITEALRLLKGSPAIIVETGSAAWGTKSTLLFDGYVHSFGGEFHSVDSRLEPMFTLAPLCSPSTTLHCDDSVQFLKKIVSENKRIDLLYLDSWDLDLKDPVPAAIHGLAEFLTILPAMGNGSIVLIDDTPLRIEDWNNAQDSSEVARSMFFKCLNQYGIPPGKGSLVKLYLSQLGRGHQIAHNYQLIWQL